MANEECNFEASVTEDELNPLNSPKGLKDAKKSESVSVKSKREITQDSNCDETFSQVSQVPCKEFRESKSEELFENIPDLKKTFVITSKIGEGTFSNVYLAHLVGYPDEMFALKHIIPTSSPDRVEREVRCLQEMGGKNNVIGYNGTIRHCDHNVIILPYFSHERFQDYFCDMSVSDIQDYMKNLLLALKHIHSFSIIHRDIKPGNFLHSRANGRYNLVDFGLAMHEPNSDNAWDIEKKNDKYTKSANVKNTRQLSPESSKNGQVNKKQRTSPRVISHKLTRQPTTKSTAKESVTGNNNGKKLSDVSSRDQNRDLKFVSPSDQVKPVNGKSSSAKLPTGLCQTKHKIHEICSLCIKRATQSAPRAGTSGFRAPEVLLKYPQQTTAVDVWSAGIIMLCLLSGKYPFFRCTDDMSALAQLITLFGKKRMMDSTKHLGKYMVSNTASPGYELRDLCQKMRFAKRVRKNNEFEINCCSSCSKTLVKTETESKSTSPASNLRRTSLRSLKVISKDEGLISSISDDKGGIHVTINRDGDIAPRLARSKENNAVEKASAVENTRTEILQTSPEERLNDGLKSEEISHSNDPRSNSVSDIKSSKPKVRFLSAGHRPMTEGHHQLSEGHRQLSEGHHQLSESDRQLENPHGCSHDESSRKHLDGTLCICNCGSCQRYVPMAAYDLLKRCLDLNPATRITASDALSHPFLRDSVNCIVSSKPER